MENRRGVTSRAEFVIAEQKWFAKIFLHTGEGKAVRPDMVCLENSPASRPKSFRAWNTQFSAAWDL